VSDWWESDLVVEDGNARHEEERQAAQQLEDEHEAARQVEAEEEAQQLEDEREAARQVVDVELKKALQLVADKDRQLEVAQQEPEKERQQNFKVEEQRVKMVEPSFAYRMLDNDLAIINAAGDDRGNEYVASRRDQQSKWREIEKSSMRTQRKRWKRWAPFARAHLERASLRAA
jgi:hypothetical protein